MPTKSHSRSKHFHLLWNERLFYIWLLAAWNIYSFIATVLEFLPQHDQKKYGALHVAAYFFSVPWSWRIVLLLAIILVWVFESSFRLHRKALSQINDSDEKIASFTSKDAELQRAANQAQIEVVEQAKIQNLNFSIYQQKVAVPNLNYRTGPGADRSFIVEGHSSVKIKRSELIGNPRVAYVSGSSVLEFDDGRMIGVADGESLKYPAPTGEFSKTSNAELKSLASDLYFRFREFQARLTLLEKERPLISNRDIQDKWSDELYARISTEFSRDFRSQALSVLCEILNRVDPVERQPLEIGIRLGFESIIHNKPLGHYPIGGAAELFDFLSLKL